MIRVLATGKLKDRHWVEGEAEYLKRMKDWWRMDVLELPGSKLTDEAAARREEETTQLKALEGWKGVVVALSEDGGWTVDSVKFSGQMAAWRDEGRDVLLLIGGASGLGEGVKARADKLWSLGKLTLPHQMVRVVLAEQVYRAMTLATGHPYHRV